MTSRPQGAAPSGAAPERSGRARRIPAILLAVALGCRGEGDAFTPPPIDCPEGASPEFVRFSDTRVESRRSLSDVAWRCLRGGGIRHGPSKEWYASGQVSAITEWQEGEKHGRFEMWHPNGQKRAEGAHSYWTPIGVWTTWDEDGQVLTTKDFGPAAPDGDPSAAPEGPPASAPAGAEPDGDPSGSPEP